MRKIVAMIEALVFSIFSLDGAIAQYTIQAPGEAPTNITRIPNGDTVRQTPGQAPSYATPSSRWGVRGSSAWANADDCYSDARRGLQNANAWANTGIRNSEARRRLRD